MRHVACLAVCFALASTVRTGLADDTSPSTSQQMYLIKCLLAERSDAGKVRVVSRPHVMTINRVPAQISVGQEVPIPGTAQIERMQVGVHLNLVPKRMDEKRVLLDVAVEVREAQKATLEELYVTGRSLRSVSVLEIGKTETYVIDRLPNGKTHRWLEIEVASNVVTSDKRDEKSESTKEDTEGGDETEPPKPMVLRVYSVAEILKPVAGQKKDGREVSDIDALVQGITQNVAPRSWTDAGGEGTVAPYLAAMGVVVRQTSKVHDELADYLESLR